MTTIDKHELNKLLAKWAGVEIFNENGYWVLSDNTDVGEQNDGGLITWDPLTDANQMELVKAGLRKAHIPYEIRYWASRNTCEVSIDIENVAHAQSEYMALALAIHTMEENNVG